MADEKEKDEAQPEEIEAPKKGSKKLLIIGLLAGLLVGGGGAAGFFIMQSGEEEVAPAIEEVVEVEPELPDYQYARMDRLQLPVFYKGRILNYAVMDVSMEVIGNNDKLLAVKNVLIVRDSLLRHYSVNSVGREDNPRIVDFDKLSKKITEFANAEANKEIVQRVVISESRSF